MQAVVFKGKLKVAVEERPLPRLQDPKDIIVKIRYTALCGSELHVYRGDLPSGRSDFIMGHEFTGEVVETGSDVTQFQKGDYVVTPFTTNCGECFYCERGFSSRCQHSMLFGSAVLDGGQAGYCRIPFADGCVLKAPNHIREHLLVLMADIFPTGYFAAANAFKGLDQALIRESVVLLIGCGPVALCALVAALDYNQKIILAIDSIESRLDAARQLGAEPWNYMTNKKGLEERVKELTDGRGADIAVEVVGHSDALDLAFNLLRPYGNISSVGVHSGPIPWTGNQAFHKNLRIEMGRCPVRSLYPAALNSFARHQDKLECLAENIKPLSEAPIWYKRFNAMEVQKIIFDASR
ncbi:S-glutathione dehydrogenase [Xylogone sp. PMI_703]|nr:S-glutathione dehydrogenase [Xylogone sp. PMI_703]